jgi:hypothetical protein
MKRFFILAVLTLAPVPHAHAAAARQTQTPAAQAGDKAKPGAKVEAAVWKSYTGRYELGAGLIPIIMLDVTLENNELRIKPTLVKKRRLVATRARRSFPDEIDGTRYTFNRDEDGRIASLTFQYEGSAYTAQKVALPPPSLKGNIDLQVEGLCGGARRRARRFVR